MLNKLKPRYYHLLKNPFGSSKTLKLILKYLLQHKGNVCERTQIIRDVWDIHFDYNTSIIEVYINALRKKLDLQKEEDAIQTIRGIGYIAKEA